MFSNEITVLQLIVLNSEGCLVVKANSWLVNGHMLNFSTQPRLGMHTNDMRIKKKNMYRYFEFH